jgi:arabinofuranan 3-O-arabinosyltransferase
MTLSLTASAPAQPEPETETEETHPAAARAGSERWWRIGGLVVVALLAYIPLLGVRPGVVTPDTKTYLYLDPTHFLSQVAFMWNPTVALGTVNHQYIGYLLPMGPFFAIFSLLHVPMWVAQRLWLGSILLAAGWGILFLCRTMRLRGPGPIVAALAYMLSPYFLQYAGRISVILLPWAGLPIMVALTMLALRRGGWRMPALFALVVALVSGINATAIIYVGIAPILWLLYAVVVLRQATWRQAGATAVRIGVLTAGVSLWWLAGLLVEAGYGVNILKFTETVPSTSATSNASEVIRGLGYWYFYGTDHLGPWSKAAVSYTQENWLLIVSYAAPVLAVVAAAVTRWRARGYFIALVVVGLVLSVGPFPYAHPTAVGGVLKAFMSDTTAGLALRSTDRATPVVLIGLAMLLGGGVTALWRRVSFAGVGVAVLAVALIVAANPSLFNGQTIANNFTQPAALPAYQLQAIKHLNATHKNTRVLAIPGNDFASYNWGDTVDTPQPAYLTRPFVTREQQVMGSIPTADTLYALDDPIQEDIANYNALAPMARLLSAGDLMVEYDQNYAHFGVPQSQLLANQLETTPPGLTDPLSFGPPRPNVSPVSTLDEQDLAAPTNVKPPSPVVTYTVTKPRPILRAESDKGALIVSGDATGINDLAGLGLLNTASAIYYSGTLHNQPARTKALAKAAAQLVVTDTNRKQAFRWDTLYANAGYTETPKDNPAKTDPSDSPIELFPGAPLSTKTTAKYVGAVNVTASSYGNAESFSPENRAYSAVDNNFDTAWTTGIFVTNPAGQWWQEQFAHPVTTNHITVVQPQTGDRARAVSTVTATFDGKHPITYKLNLLSLVEGGQTLHFPTRTFHTLRLTIDSTTNDTAPPLTASAVGFSEVTVPGQHVEEVVKLPTDLLAATGKASIHNRLTLVMNRQRTSPYLPPRTDPETTITRQFTLPTPRFFTLSGTASLSTLIPDNEIDQLVGRTGIAAYSSGRLPGDLAATASATLDDNPATAWQPGLGLGAQVGATLTYDLTAPTILDQLNMQVIADGRHSVPTTMTIEADGQTRKIAVPPITDRAAPGSVVNVPVQFPALLGQQFVVTFTGVRQNKAANYDSAGPLTLPLGIASIGMPGAPVPVTPAQLPGTCTAGLLTVDGQPIDVAIEGSTQSALNNGQVRVVPCGPNANGVLLSAGTHLVQTSVAHAENTGWNIDQLVLDSAAGGLPAPAPTTTASGVPGLAATPAGPAPTVTVTATHTDSQAARVTGAHAPFELVLGQSINAGWQAVANPGPHAPSGSHPVNLGTPQLIDSFANGWAVTGADLKALGGPSFTVALTWTPQRNVWIALFLSGLTIVLCLVLGFLPERWRLRLRRRTPRWLLGATPLPVQPDAGPTLDLTHRRDGDAVAWWKAALTGVVAGLLAAAVTSWWAALVVAVIVGASLRSRPLRWVVTVGAVGFIVAGCVNVVYRQITDHYLPGSNWPGTFITAGNLIWIGMILLLADAMIVIMRASGRAGPKEDDADDDGPPPADDPDAVSTNGASASEVSADGSVSADETESVPAGTP